ncbi:hypothetical protein GTW25_19910 [Aliihoeflea aestuarii]|jgi:uncharacterized protein YifN (PemK superfamily)|nr:type II toxin-antitoxin system PemK/MazF family toxin [Aliihoeflea aestuarii]MCO6393289.1 hypothetical protein [Aliihoeflea aestuarii]
MALKAGIFPQAGQVLICNFGPDPDKIAEPGIMTGPLGVKPEMYKERHCVVLSAGRGLTTIVPFSTVAPRTPQKYHFCIPPGSYGFFDPHEENWLKADMLETVSNERLDQPFFAGKRSNVKLSKDHSLEVRRAVLHWLGFSRLTEHL